jgi:signal transduction histidine kinase
MNSTVLQGLLVTGAPTPTLAWSDLFAQCKDPSWNVTILNSDALDQLASFIASPPDFILVHLCTVREFALVQELRARLSVVPLVVLGDASATTNVEELEASALEAGADECLVRQHLTPYWLQYVIRRLLQRRRASHASAPAATGATPDKLTSLSSTTELVQAYALLHQVMDTLPVGVWIMDREGKIVHGNREGQRIWVGNLDVELDESYYYRGWRPESGEPLRPDEWSGVRAARTGEATLDEVLEIEALDGTRRMLLSSAIPMHNAQQEFVGAIVVNQDISDRRQIELELQEVRRHLEEGREEERVYLARELHDVPMQELHAAEFAWDQLKSILALLTTAGRRQEADSNQVSLIQEAQQLGAAIGEHMRNANRVLRELCNELRPPILESFGLSAAVEAHARIFQDRYQDLVVHLDLAKDNLMLPDWVGLALFRIYQQALDNVVQHAQASQVFVRLYTTPGQLASPDQLVLEVRDNGRGFVVPPRWVELARANHLGIIGAVERASHIGGTYKITSTPGNGTTVQVTLPLDRPADSQAR